MIESTRDLYFDYLPSEEELQEEDHINLPPLLETQFNQALNNGKEIVWVYKVLLIHVAIALAVLTYLLLHNLDLVYQSLGLLLVSLNITMSHMYAKLFTSIRSDLRKYTYPLLAPALLIAARKPYSAYSFICCCLLMCYGFHKNKFHRKPEAIMSYVAMALIVTVCFKIDGIPPWSWESTLAIHHFFMFILSILLLVGVLRLGYVLKNQKMRRKTILETVTIILSLVSLFYLMFLTFIWLYLPSLLLATTITGLIYTLIIICLYLYRSKEIIYIHSRIPSIFTVSRLSQLRFTAKQLKSLYGREPALCILCQHRKARIVVLNCYHVTFCTQCHKKANLRLCPVCNVLKQGHKRIVYSNQLQNTFFKIKMFSEGQFKLYSL